MNNARRLLVLIAGAAGLWACAAPQRLETPARPTQTVVVLMPDPESGIVGKAVVSNAFGTVDLATARGSTLVSAGQPPAAVTPLDEGEAQKLFADALSALPSQSRKFTLFFRFDSEELTDEGRALVPDVLKAAQDMRAPDVVVVGHTDTTGTPAANFDLGLRRANTVRKLLLEAGLDSALVEVSSHGEADPLVPTADATFEPRNRRVEITIR